MRKMIWVVMGLFGLWFLASAVTSAGLLPSGHGPGRLAEVLIGLALVGYAAFRLRQKT